ncbi:unnamed protein product [Fusarium venenatum]|uniref:Ecp2 effector protein-like domain-containing protein n=1 Tax=Fusarium venenatum TaxID=56646 RepID=A0A2L2T4X8_9HYPO|nr:uncharacterized protein FVRRES_04457 [Fusarium venenatum]CEI60021.1 unnamed protein product [Fusarium venenatum]
MNALIDVDVTHPDIVRLPVCSPEKAYQAWDTGKPGTIPFYPCEPPAGRKTCGDSSFENETSDKSPLIKDCLDIIKNIDTTLVGVLRQRQIVNSGSYALGVEATKADRNADFVVGGQDVINIINTAIGKYGKNDKIGAVGNMDCTGTVKKESIH